LAARFQGTKRRHVSRNSLNAEYYFGTPKQIDKLSSEAQRVMQQVIALGAAAGAGAGAGEV
jgi:hypothetical protein